MEYWTAVLKLIKDTSKSEGLASLTVVCEDYRLYASASEAQINSNLETPQFIGAIKWFCYVNHIPIVMQMAAEVKTRWSNEVMMNKGLLGTDSRNRYHMSNLILSNHSLDAVRHLLHYITFKTKKRPMKPDLKTYERRYDCYD